MSEAAQPAPLLEVRDLVVEFPLEGGVLRAVDGVSLQVGSSETVGVVGESGCGKSVTALSILRLVPSPGRVVSGEVIFDGEDLLRSSEHRLRQVRGSRIGMVFQEPMSALNPTMRVGDQVGEAYRLHRGAGRAEGRARALELLRRVGIPDAQACRKAYPHQLSGGMQQRVLLAAALACDPLLLIADEPTTALDVTLQAEVMELLRQAQRERAMGVLLVTHDLALVAETCSRVVVLYAGQVVEQGWVTDCFASPRHPYTAALLRAVRSLGQGGRLAEIPGALPDPLAIGPGCRFADRCDRIEEDCRSAAVSLEQHGDRSLRCLHPVPLQTARTQE